MRVRLPYIAVCLATLIACLAIFFVFDHIRFLRFVVGDFLVVICIYALIKSFFPRASPVKTGGGVFVFSVAVELAQYSKITRLLDPDHPLSQMTFGNTFDYLDLIAYAAGLLLVATADLLLSPTKIPKPPYAKS